MPLLLSTAPLDAKKTLDAAVKRVGDRVDEFILEMARALRSQRWRRGFEAFRTCGFCVECPLLSVLGVSTELVLRSWPKVYSFSDDLTLGEPPTLRDVVDFALFLFLRGQDGADAVSTTAPVWWNGVPDDKNSDAVGRLLRMQLRLRGWNGFLRLFIYLGIEPLTTFEGWLGLPVRASHGMPVGPLSQWLLSRSSCAMATYFMSALLLVFLRDGVQLWKLPVVAFAPTCPCKTQPVPCSVTTTLLIAFLWKSCEDPTLLQLLLTPALNIVSVAEAVPFVQLEDLFFPELMCLGRTLQPWSGGYHVLEHIQRTMRFRLRLKVGTREVERRGSCVLLQCFDGLRDTLMKEDRDRFADADDDTDDNADRRLLEYFSKSVKSVDLLKAELLVGLRSVTLAPMRYAWMRACLDIAEEPVCENKDGNPPKVKSKRMSAEPASSLLTCLLADRVRMCISAPALEIVGDDATGPPTRDHKLWGEYAGIVARFLWR